MNAVRIAVKCELSHRAAIYTAITSMVRNKSNGIEYNIYLLVNSEEEKTAFNDILKMRDENVSFEFVEGIKNLQNTGKLILLSWNTLVQGDLSVLYNYNMQDKSVALAENYPDKDCYFSNESEFSDSVILLDSDKCPDTDNLSRDDICIFPAFYNLAFEELLTRKKDIAFGESQELYNECANSEELALILRFDKELSPEFFFDTRMEYLWMKYYKQSPVGDELLNRKSSINNSGNIPDYNPDNIPILIRVADETVYNAAGLIDSIKKNNTSKRNLDIRLVYKNLSSSNSNLLSDERDEYANIKLHGICTDVPDELIATAMFACYDKAICLNAKALVECNIGDVFDTDLKGNYICAMSDENVKIREVCEGKFTEIFSNMNFFGRGITIVNIQAWIRDELGTQIIKAQNKYKMKNCPFYEILNMLCMKKRQFLPGDTKILFDYSEPEEYEKLLDSYISENKNAARLIAGRAVFLVTEEEEMTETLKRLEAIQKENENLKQTNEQLRCENERLSGESGQYLYELLETRKSQTYKIGRAITYIPRMIRSGGSD